MRRRSDPYPFPAALLFTPGSEVAGEVCALGPGVSGPPVGSPVFALVGTGPQTATGGYAEYAVADATRVLPLPPGLAPDVACSLLVAGFTALVSLREIARLEHGQHVLVQAAAGGVGSYAVQLARALGAGVVLGTASTPARRAHARALGADHVLDSRAPGATRRGRPPAAGARTSCSNRAGRRASPTHSRPSRRWSSWATRAGRRSPWTRARSSGFSPHRRRTSRCTPSTSAVGSSSAPGGPPPRLRIPAARHSRSQQAVGPAAQRVPLVGVGGGGERVEPRVARHALVAAAL